MGTEHYEAAFYELKKWLLDFPILIYPNFDLGSVPEIDTSIMTKVPHCCRRRQIINCIQ